MNDCIYFSIGVCDGDCGGCVRYLSMNIPNDKKVEAIIQEYGEAIDKQMEPALEVTRKKVLKDVREKLFEKYSKEG